MDRLPADLLPVVIEHLVLGCLIGPRCQSPDLRSLLSCRAVCQAFNREILYLVPKHVTLPNLTQQRRALHRLQGSFDGISKTRNGIIAAALFNSCMSINNRLVLTPMVNWIKRCVQVAHSRSYLSWPATQPQRPVTESQYTVEQLTRMVCETAAKTQLCYTMLFESADIPWPGEMNEYCIAAMLGETDFLLSIRAEGPPILHRMCISPLLGYWASCAGLNGHLDTVKTMIPSRGQINQRVEQIAMEQGLTDFLELLLSAEKNGNPVYTRGHYKRLVAESAKTGNIEVLRVVFNSITPKNYRSGKEYKAEVLKHRHTALCTAIRYAQTDATRFLLDYDVDINGQSGPRDFPLDIAENLGFTTIAKILRDAGATLANRNKAESDSTLYNGFQKTTHKSRFKELTFRNLINDRRKKDPHLAATCVDSCVRNYDEV